MCMFLGLKVLDAASFRMRWRAMSIFVQCKYLTKGTETLMLFSSKEVRIQETTVAKVRVINPFKVLNNCISYTPERNSSGI